MSKRPKGNRSNAIQAALTRPVGAPIDLGFMVPPLLAARRGRPAGRRTRGFGAGNVTPSLTTPAAAPHVQFGLARYGQLARPPTMSIRRKTSEKSAARRPD